MKRLYLGKKLFFLILLLVLPIANLSASNPSTNETINFINEKVKSLGRYKTYIKINNSIITKYNYYKAGVYGFKSDVKETRTFNLNDVKFSFYTSDSRIPAYSLNIICNHRKQCINTKRTYLNNNKNNYWTQSDTSIGTEKYQTTDLEKIKRALEYLQRKYGKKELF